MEKPREKSSCCFKEQKQQEKGRKKRSRYESDSSEECSTSNSSEYEDKPSTSTRDNKLKRRRRHSSSSDSSSITHNSTNSSDDDSVRTSSSGDDVSAKQREKERRQEKKKALKKSKSLKKKYRKKKATVDAAGNAKKKKKRKDSSRENAASSSKAAKKEKKLKKKAAGDGDFYSGMSITTPYGKYGLLQESDMWKKRPEFSLWLMEVKGKHLEHLHNWEEKELFKTYMEDYNTATLPSKKYYNLEVYEARQRLKQVNVQEHCELTDFNDEARRKQEIRALREKQKIAEAEEQLRAMRNDRSKVADMREQLMLKSRVETLYRLGRNAEAKKLAENLQPE